MMGSLCGCSLGELQETLCPASVSGLQPWKRNDTTLRSISKILRRAMLDAFYYCVKFSFYGKAKLFSHSVFVLWAMGSYVKINFPIEVWTVFFTSRVRFLYFWFSPYFFLTGLKWTELQSDFLNIWIKHCFHMLPELSVKSDQTTATKSWFRKICRLEFVQFFCTKL